MTNPKCLHCPNAAHYKLSKGFFSLLACSEHFGTIYAMGRERLGLPFLITKLVINKETIKRAVV